MDTHKILQVACRLCTMAYQDGVSGVQKVDECAGTQVLCTTLQNPSAGSSCLLGSFEVQMNKYLVIAFRGTDAMSDWQYNISLLKKSVANESDNRFFVPRVHGGFLSQYNSLKEVLNREMSHFNCDVKLIVTGHSLGGALACICAHDFIQNTMRQKANIQLVTFGCPRPGNRVFKTDIETSIECLRVVNGNDIITYTPLVNAFHVGVLKHIGVGGLFSSVTDHSVEAYQSSLSHRSQQALDSQKQPEVSDSD